MMYNNFNNSTFLAKWELKNLGDCEILFGALQIPLHVEDLSDDEVFALVNHPACNAEALALLRLRFLRLELFRGPVLKCMTERHQDDTAWN